MISNGFLHFFYKLVFEIKDSQKLSAKINFDLYIKINYWPKTMITNNFKKTKTNEVIAYLFNLVQTRCNSEDTSLPSEAFICNKFKCSRIIAIAAYNKLKAIGAVNIIEKKGRFAVKNFNNLIKPLSYAINCDRDTTEKVKGRKKADWLLQFGVNYKKFNQYYKQYYKNDELIMTADYYLAPELNIGNNFNEISITHKLAYENMTLERVNYHLKCENIEMFGSQKIIVVYMEGYYQNEICVCARYLIDPNHFIFRHDEYNLFF
ncbi:GntR family transcriptional repressor for pyruvate dehydrogenase complex [Mycoplasmoides fastidiosum]|uniref:GntR family transcriptional repressor for pyruvate dehydrogenase complex n=1 Tax=Mycoplasmoides fastidiosum TaxID=92758 RepID=A0ABU0LYQ3_9BACT|nr:hypothetical protein [Mycoplasmoides fastidiosum]MDQ0513848.1 GntR family transcriptional repressor for pyruvate dehydrogenase complex [Mycoplasmoides fastidiosum]UUD37736.1 hypothetical protein NPA10_04175 [Mycoplasmoides fastidiosum]